MKHIYVLILIMSVGITLNAQVPTEFIGNWVNAETNDWTYGIYEDFVIYENDFWNYKEIKEKGKKRLVSIVKDDQTVFLEFKKDRAGNLNIKQNRENSISYFKQGKGYAPYPKKDTSFFEKTLGKKDTITIRGYIRNFDEIPQDTPDLKKLTSPVITIGYRDFLISDQVQHHADIDSLGRFELKFTIDSAKELFFDWGRMSRYLFLEPGDEIFYFTDFIDFIPDPNQKMGYWDFMALPKSIAYMGDNSRVNNELANHFIIGTQFHFSVYGKEYQTLSDTNFLKKGDSITAVYHKAIDTLIDEHPNLSDKFNFVQRKKADNNLAFSLMQRSFQVMRRDNKVFEDGYMQYVENRFPLNDNLAWEANVFSLIRTYLLNYTMYKISLLHKDNSYTYPYIDNLKDALTIEKGEQNKKQIEFVINLHNDNLISKDDTEKHWETLEEVRKMESVATVRDNYFRLKRIYRIIEDTKEVLNNSYFQDLYISEGIYSAQNHYMIPFNDEEAAKIMANIESPYLRNRLKTLNDYYIVNQNKNISYEASLISNENLREAKDADILFEKIMQSHKGKVVYVDFWGTWCGPCMGEMPHVKKIKKHFKDKEVVFLYFANRTPKTSWENALKNFELTGPQSFHYNLPSDQQQMLERKFGINSFPTYMIFNKEGELMNSKAMRLSMGIQTINEIEKYL